MASAPTFVETQSRPGTFWGLLAAGGLFLLAAFAAFSSFPRFLVIASKDSTPIKYSIFAIQKFIQCGVGEVKEAKKLSNGTVLLEVKTKQQAMKALGMTVWFDTEITVTPHRSLNTSRGVIRCRDLRDCDDAEVEWPRLTRRHCLETYYASQWI